MESIKTKSISDFLDDDKALMEKILYDEFINKTSTPRNADHPISNVIKTLEAFVESAGREN